MYCIIQGHFKCHTFIYFTMHLLESLMYCCCILQKGQRSSLPALWWVNDSGEEVKWSFEELGFHSRKLANVLHQVCSLERGDRVFLILPRVPEWWLVNVACLRTGTVSQTCWNRFVRHLLREISMIFTLVLFSIGWG